MRNFILTLVTLTLATTMLAGCGNEPPTAGAATEFSAVCARENDGKRVAVDGYLYFPDSFTDSQSVVLRLHETEDDVGTPIGVQISFGAAPNQVEEVADQFSDDDLRVHLADGKVAGFGEQVTVSGKVYFPVVDQVFPCALENPLVELPD
jgi:hypothetical protein